MAAAARLAKRRHRVRLLVPGDRLAPEWRPAGPDAPSPLPEALVFPAPWRDLFKKSGRILGAELTLEGLDLVPAPPIRHVFADGTELELGGDRGQQFHQLEAAHGTAVAQAWRDLVDSLEPTWQLVRTLGLETSLVSPRQVRPHRAALAWGTSVADLAAAQPHPHLRALVEASVWQLGHDPARTPAFVASRLCVQRTFGRWMVVDGHGVPAGSQRLLDLVDKRLATRRVEVVYGAPVAQEARDGRGTRDGAADATVVAGLMPEDFAPWLPRRSWAHRLRHRDLPDPARGLSRLRPALRPTLSTVDTAPGRSGVREVVDHAQRRVCYATGTRTLVHDWGAARPDPAAGPAWDGPNSWFDRLPVRLGEGVYAAGAWGRGGNDLAGILMSAALATYDAHFDLTGLDTHPSNKEQ